MCKWEYVVRDGKLTDVKVLHENNTEGCANLIMDLAAKGGHLDIVQWLHENRSEGCTRKARSG